jgi:two-component system sensor histidine kinase VicK
MPYRNYYTSQNLFAVRSGSLIFLILNLIVRLLYLIFPSSLTKAENFPEFNLTNWITIVVTAIFYILSYVLVEENRKTKKATAIMALFVFSFAIYIIFCGMFSSFIATADPRNALIFYLIALFIISVLCIFEYYETIILIVAAELLFTTLLIRSNTDPTEMIYNQLVSVMLLGGFYLVSRYYFNYKANYYLQVIEIQEKNMAIERGSEFKSQLLGIVAHDLRNPIAAVESLAMIMEMDDIDEDTQDNLNLMKASCVKARTIIDELLEAARNDNTLEFSTHKTELNKLLNEIIFLWKLERETTNNIVLVSTVSPIYAQINAEKFHRVIDNLISNALKFSKEKSKVEVFLTRRDNSIIIEVKDHGVGIPAAMLPFVFEPFSKAGRTGLKGEQSTGLGLSIVRQIIEKHNGKIEVESEEGKGSTFRLALPVAGE